MFELLLNLMYRLGFYNHLNMKTKTAEYNVGYAWLKDNGFSKKDISYIEKIYDEEGIRFCKKTFLSQDLNGMKEELKDIHKKENRKENENIYRTLFSSVKGVNIDKALSYLF